MNRVCLVGRLTAKPELRTIGSGTSTTRFTLAVNRTFSNAQGERETDFISIVAWRAQAENVCKYLDKGSLVSVDGRIQTGSYDDKDGKKVYTTDVVADQINFLESKKDRAANTSNGGGNEYYPEPPANDVNVSEDPFANFGDSVSIDDNFLD